MSDPQYPEPQDLGAPHPWTYRAPCCAVRKPIIEVSDLRVDYGRNTALRDVSVTIGRGCITAIIGPSGCGKSTFLGCLNRTTELTEGVKISGHVRLQPSHSPNDVHGTAAAIKHRAGEELYGDGIDLVALRRRVGMIFQKPNPFPLSIVENLTFGLKHHGMSDRHERDAAAETALRRVGLWEEVKDRLDTSALRLSGGQQQRLCLARALVLTPEVLLLDEPCSALDPISSGAVEDLIASLRDTYTLIIVTHNLPQARRIADDVAMFWVDRGAGTLIESGSAAEIFESPDNAITAAYIRGARG